MAPRHSHSDSSNDDDSDAPEAVSLSHSKKQVQKLETERKKAEGLLRESKKAHNRERDQRLKDRAKMNKAVATKGKGKGKEVANEADELQARMERAMQDAEEESGDDDDDDEMGAVFEDFEGISSEIEGEEDAESGEEDDDDGDLDDDEEEQTAPTSLKSRKVTFNVDHLPDEIFAAAFASQSKRKLDSETDNKNDSSSKPASKKRKASSKPKDVVVGSRAIRMLPKSTQPSLPSTLPSKKLKKFLDRSLALKGGKQPSKTWERRPANIGVLRRGGPALSFVRNP